MPGVWTNHLLSNHDYSFLSQYLILSFCWENHSIFRNTYSIISMTKCGYSPNQLLLDPNLNMNKILGSAILLCIRSGYDQKNWTRICNVYPTDWLQRRARGWTWTSRSPSSTWSAWSRRSTDRSLSQSRRKSSKLFLSIWSLYHSPEYASWSCAHPT